MQNRYKKRMIKKEFWKMKMKNKKKHKIKNQKQKIKVGQKWMKNLSKYLLHGLKISRFCIDLRTYAKTLCFFLTI